MGHKTRVTNTVRCAAAAVLLIILLSCGKTANSTEIEKSAARSDSLALLQMIREREKAMTYKDIGAAMGQFSEQATWINSQGYYFQGKGQIQKFHIMLAGNDSLDYYYEAGEPNIRLIDRQNALAYYAWKMFWYRKDNPADTTLKEIGLMSLTAHKTHDEWQWIAVTNQHAPWFYEKIEPVVIDND